MSFDAMVTRQWGLVTWDQLLGFLGVGRARADIEAGRFIRLLRGVYRVAGVPPVWRQRPMAAYLAIGDPSAVGFRCGARLHALPGVPGRPVELVAPSFMRPRLAGVRVHRSTFMPPRHMQRMDALAITTVERVICDITAKLSDETVARILRGAVRLELTSYEAVAQTREEIRARGRRRTTVLDRVLESAIGRPGDSEGEYKLLEWISGAGLPAPVQQFWVSTTGGRYCLDAAYVGEKIDIEWDSDLHEKTPEDVEYDAARDIELELVGWFIMRNSRLTQKHDFLRRLREALEKRAPT